MFYVLFQRGYCRFNENVSLGHERTPLANLVVGDTTSRTFIVRSISGLLLLRSYD